MIFGILKDIKEEEFRVICTPMEVHSIRAAGHEVWAQHDCGKLAGFPDEAYAAAGARIVETAEEMYAGCDMVAKVKEFTPAECAMMHPGQIVLGCIHPAAHPEEVDALLKSKCIAFTAEDCHRHGTPYCDAAVESIQIKTGMSGPDPRISLTGPANKQGRIAADNICGMNKTYRGGNGSSVIKVFDLTCAFTGLNTAAARRAGIDFDRVVLFSANHATYYPGARNMTLKVLFERKSGRIIGAQAVGYEGVDKRIDVLAAAMGAKMTAYDLQELDLAYAPPYSSAKHPVNMAGYVIEDVLGGIKQYHWEDLPKVLSDPAAFILDVRTAEEFAEGHFEGAVNIPVDELRARLGEIDGGKTVYVNCHSGLRSYIACRILMAHGFDCFNFSGGYRLYAAVKGEAEESDVPRHPCGIPVV